MNNKTFFNTIYCLCSLLLIIFASSCGYTFEGSGSVLPTDIKTISIKLADNETVYPGLGPQFTEKLRSRFERYGAVKVVEPEDDADAELKTKIVSVESRVQNSTGDTDVALEMELLMTVAAEIKRRSGQIIYRNNNLRAKDRFASTSQVVVTSSSAFAQSGIGADSLGTLSDREVSRGQAKEAMEGLMEDAARRLYLDAVAAEF